MRITSEEGDFHARLAGEIDEEELALLKSLGNVESVEINGKESDGEKHRCGHPAEKYGGYL